MEDTTKKVLDENRRKQLEGLTSFNVNSTTYYTPSAYAKIDADLRPKFKVRPLRQDESAKIKKILTSAKDMDSPENEDILNEVGRNIILDFTSFYDAGTGEEILHKSAPDGGMDRDIFGIIPQYIVSDILMYVIKISGLVNVEKLGL